MTSAYVSAVSPLGDHPGGDAPEFSWSDSFQKYSYLGLIALVGLLTFSYWNMLEATAAYWDDDQYSHGWIVPLIGLYLLWSRRPNPAAQEPPEGAAEETFMGLVPASLFGRAACGGGAALAVAGLATGLPVLQGLGIALVCLAGLAYVMVGQPFERVSIGERWAGLGILLAGYAVRIFIGAGYYSQPADRYSFLIALLGGLVMVGGWHLLKWAGPGFGFLFFMYPLPSVVENKGLLFLQKLAAVASEMVLTILGQPVIREGNKIVVDGIPLEVAEACSGLRMVTIFGAMAVALVLVTSRPWWDKLIILLSAIPIALIVNVTRIVVTALLYRAFPEGEAVHQLIHDYAGLAMMPLAMGLLYLELKLLSMLTVEDEGIEMSHGGFGAAAPTA